MVDRIFLVRMAIGRVPKGIRSSPRRLVRHAAMNGNVAAKVVGYSCICPPSMGEHPSEAFVSSIY